MKNNPILILGCGYTGKAILDAAPCQPFAVTHRSQKPAQHGEASLEFRLDDKATWAPLQKYSQVIWTFSPEPFDAVKEFYDATFASRACRHVVLGTTSVYQVLPEASQELPIVNENSAVDDARERVKSERYLAGRGATILRSAGIYGPGRNPLNWIRKGLVSASDKVVNLIHVDDLARACLAALAPAHAGAIYNISDGQAYRWRAICQFAKENFGITVSDETTKRARSPDKKIDNQKMCAQLLAPRHLDLYDELRDIESMTHA